jgi:hypothetical protein
MLRATLKSQPTQVGCQSRRSILRYDRNAIYFFYESNPDIQSSSNNHNPQRTPRRQKTNSWFCNINMLAHVMQTRNGSLPKWKRTSSWLLRLASSSQVRSMKFPPGRRGRRASQACFFTQVVSWRARRLIDAKRPMCRGNRLLENGPSQLVC